MIMHCLRCLSVGRCMRILTLLAALLLLTTGCDRQTVSPPSDSVPGEVRTFNGTWSAVGNRQTMKLESDHQAVIFKLTGSLLLTGEKRLRKGFKAELLGFSDNRIGMQARGVWTDEYGDKVFSELHSEATEPGMLITGRFLGGTGRYTTVNGEYTFRWRRLINNENGEISGRTVDLKGWARLGASDTLPSTTGGQQ